MIMRIDIRREAARRDADQRAERKDAIIGFLAPPSVSSNDAAARVCTTGKAQQFPS
jgi:hypothetical protein